MAKIDVAILRETSSLASSSPSPSAPPTWATEGPEQHEDKNQPEKRIKNAGKCALELWKGGKPDMDSRVAKGGRGLTF